jgi:hypothetical protein
VDPVLAHRLANCTIGSWENGLWIVWTGPVTLDAVKIVDRFSQQLVKEHDRIFSISISMGPSEMPDAETRAYSSRLVKKYARHTSMSVTLLEGEGFWVGASRMIVQAIYMVSGQRDKTSVCSTEREAARVLAAYVRPEAKDLTVLAAIRAMKRITLADANPRA